MKDLRQELPRAFVYSFCGRSKNSSGVFVSTMRPTSMNTTRSAALARTSLVDDAQRGMRAPCTWRWLGGSNPAVARCLSESYSGG